MFSKNMATLLAHIIQDGKLNLDMKDKINRETAIAHGGIVVNGRVRELLGLKALTSDADDQAEANESVSNVEKILES